MNTTQHGIYGTPRGHHPFPLFIDSEGRIYDGNVLSLEIRHSHKEVIGLPLRKQLEALGLIHAFETGSTPYQLPYTMA